MVRPEEHRFGDADFRLEAPLSDGTVFCGHESENNVDADCRLDHLSGYRELVHYAVPYGEGPGLSATRECVAVLDGDAERSVAAELDELLIEKIMQLDWIDDYVLRDNAAQPMEKWWWHLGAIRRREYPAELLPEHLQEIYAEYGSETR